MSKYNTIINNDISNGEGVCVSFWVQGCPHHCEDCFNPETWDFTNGYPYTDSVKWNLIKAISANKIQRNFSVLGGEPMAPRNLDMTEDVVSSVRAAYPNIKIYLWTGYTLSNLKSYNDKRIENILSKINYLIDGPFEVDKKNLNLKLRGSTNQHIWENTTDGWIITE